MSDELNTERALLLLLLLLLPIGWDHKERRRGKMNVTGDKPYDRVLTVALTLTSLLLANANKFSHAQYGKFGGRKSAGVSLDPRLGWFLMEIPAPVSFALSFYYGRKAKVAAEKAEKKRVADEAKAKAALDKAKAAQKTADEAVDTANKALNEAIEANNKAEDKTKTQKAVNAAQSKVDKAEKKAGEKAGDQLAADVRKMVSRLFR